MKSTTYSLLGVVCLTCATPLLRAHDRVLAQVVAHDHLLFSKVETTIEMVDEGLLGASRVPAKVVAKWEVSSPGTGGTDQAPSRNVYTVTINFYQPGTLTPLVADKIYSLLSLGFQSIEGETEITRFTPTGNGKAEFYKAGSTASTALTPNTTIAIPIPRTGKQWNAGWGRDSLISNNVCLIRLSGASQFVFTVREVNLPRPGVTRWVGGAVSDGHDNTPPKNPPD